MELSPWDANHHAKTLDLFIKLREEEYFRYRSTWFEPIVGSTSTGRARLVGDASPAECIHDGDALV
jgi:hypothetical protein